MLETTIKNKGAVEIIIDYCNGAREILNYNNTLLQKGKIAQAKSLTNDVADPYDFYIDQMVFGTNGTSGGTAKFVDDSREGLFGTTLLSKSIVSSIDTSAPTTAILTAVVASDEGVGSAINEMALKMKSGDLYSMLTFPDLNKTDTMQLTFNWKISAL